MRAPVIQRVWAVRAMVTLAFAVLPLVANGMGLGRLVVRSNLDEPLLAEIDLIGPTAQELKTLSARLASRGDFDAAGVDRAAYLFDIKYALERRPDGRYVLRVTTDQQFREPFLHFLIQVDWSGGHLVREYSALLDPPQWVGAQAPTMEAPMVEVQSGTAPAPALAAEITPEPATTATAGESTPLADIPPGEVQAREVAPVAVPGEAPITAAAATPEPVASAPMPEPVPPTPESVPRVAAVAPEPAPTPREAFGPAEFQAPTPATVESLPQPAARPAQVRPAPVAQAVATADEYGPVRSGETMGEITKRAQLDREVSAEQAMLAVLRANPDAFFSNNVNNLKAGKILRIPDRGEMESLPADAARREFRSQYSAWQQYKLRVAGASRAVVVPDAPEEGGSAAALLAAKAAKDSAAKGKPAKDQARAAKDKPTAKLVGKPGSESADLLRIVRNNLEDSAVPEEQKVPGAAVTTPTGKDGRTLKDRVATMEEAVESRQMQTKEMQDRVGKLQEQVKNAERLLDVENRDLAKTQKQATEAKPVPEKPVAPAAIPAPPAAKAPVAPAPAPAAKAAIPLAAPPAADEGFLDSMVASLSGLFDDTYTLGLLGGLVVLLGGVGFVYQQRRRKATQEFSESILTGGSLQSDAGLSDGAAAAAGSDTSFLSDFSQGGMGNIHTDEVDPIAEAEVYLAYGRDEQAEEILREAITKNPTRHELKGKLAEIYFQRNDVRAFETLAEELYAALEGKGGKPWEKVEELGRKLSPNNPMFRGGKPGSSASAAPAPTQTSTLELTAPPAAADWQATTQGLNFPGAAGAPAGAARPDSLPAGEPAGGLGLDLNFGDTAGSGLDFDLGSAPESGFAMDRTEAPAGGTKGAGFDIDFGAAASEPSLDFDTSTAPAAAGGSDLDFALDAPDMKSGGNEFDIDFGGAAHDTDTLDLAVAPPPIGTETEQLDIAPGAPAGEGFQAWDETATKLDLAKAYIDMGDAEGARSILDEVMAEGNDQQKKQAKDLVTQIG